MFPNDWEAKSDAAVQDFQKYVTDHNLSTQDALTDTEWKGWTYRVDKPSSDNAKPHVHVDNNKKNIHGVENVDGTPSHGKTLDGSKVPKDVQKKVKDSKDYKKGQKDLKKMQEAKREIHRRKLNLSVNKDLLIAAGIFVTAVGVAFVAPEFLPALLAAV